MGSGIAEKGLMEAQNSIVPGQTKTRKRNRELLQLDQTQKERKITKRMKKWEPSTS